MKDIRNQFCHLFQIFSIVFIFVAMLFGMQARAVVTDMQMLPPTDFGATSICGTGANQLLVFSGDVVTGHSSINCLSKLFSDPSTGQIISGDQANGGTGGMWVGPNQFMGSNGSASLGFFNGSWQFTVDSGGNTTTNGSATVNGNATVNGTISLPNATASVGGGCSPNGELGNDGSGKVLNCIGGSWKTLGSHASASENINCNGGGGSNNCPGFKDQNGNWVFSQSTSSIHDLCVMQNIAGWAGGYRNGSCDITGAPGGIWTVTIAAMPGNQVSCTMQCYDF
jgi:hypothetical protein